MPETPPQYDLGDYVRKFRKLKEWTQDELATKSDVGVTTIRQIETRVVTTPDLKTLAKLAGTLDRPLAELVALVPGLVTEGGSESQQPVSRTATFRRRETDVMSGKARAVAEAYDRLDPLHQIAIDAIVAAGTVGSRKNHTG